MVLCVSIFGCYIFRNLCNMQNRIFCDISGRLLKPAQSVLRGGPWACGGHVRPFGARWCHGAAWGCAGRQSGSCDPRAPQPQPAAAHTHSSHVHCHSHTHKRKPSVPRPLPRAPVGSREPAAPARGRQGGNRPDCRAPFTAASNAAPAAPAPSGV